REQGTGNREQGTGNREQGTGNREQGNHGGTEDTEERRRRRDFAYILTLDLFEWIYLHIFLLMSIKGLKFINS
ncbi:hypothetical protein E1H12_14690, partial [Geitlerinema sp. P-1104]|uniref:hypothetical protein n=1 Tax=Geitlerinema sp. P-1104 TaxID=2546230 RepID=UPI0016A5B132|nr:hypothetical protein [Geitlerinema sp. P-1104]